MEASRSEIRGRVIPPGGEGYEQVRRVGPRESAFVPRAADDYLNLATSWFDPTESEANAAWTRAFFDAVEPFCRGVYVNFQGMRARTAADRHADPPTRAWRNS